MWGEECAAGRGGPRCGRRAWRTGAWREGEEGAVGPAGFYLGAVIGVCGESPGGLRTLNRWSGSGVMMWAPSWKRRVLNGL